MQTSGLTPLPSVIALCFFTIYTGFAVFFCFFGALAIYPFALKDRKKLHFLINAPFDRFSLAMYPFDRFFLNALF